MRHAFHEQLDAISDELCEMCRLAGGAMARATQALLDADLALAEQVIEGDAEIDALSYEVEEKCFGVTAMQQPVATDLRITMSALRMSGSLERMGDLAAHVAKQAQLRYPERAVPLELAATFARMGALAQEIVARTGTVIATKDISLATDIAAHDDEMDRLHRELFTTVLSPSWSHGVEAAVDVTLLSRYYERYADHAVTIARRMIHIVTGDTYAHISANVL